MLQSEINHWRLYAVIAPIVGFWQEGAMRRFLAVIGLVGLLVVI